MSESKLCRTFHADPSVHPITGLPLEEDSIQYDTLSEYCGEPESPFAEARVPSSRTPISKSQLSWLPRVERYHHVELVVDGQSHVVPYNDETEPLINSLLARGQ